MTKIKFLRRDAKRFSKFGKRRKKLLGWKKPKGRDNKMREKRKGYPSVVKVGYKNKEIKEPIIIYNEKELIPLPKEQKIILGKVGKKKKLAIVKKAQELKLNIENINIKSFLKKNDKIKKDKGEDKK